MTSSTSGSRALAGGLLALALLAGGGAALLRPVPAGPVTPTMTSLQEDCTAAEVLLLGNSKTRSDLPADELAAQLGLPRAGVASLTVHGSSGPVWFAVAENLVFRAGCRPRTVVAYGTLEKLLAADVAPDERVRLLAPVMSADEPVIQRKLFGASRGRLAWSRARQQAVGQREGLLGGITAGAVGLLARRGTTGRELLDAASRTLFGDHKVAAPAALGPLPRPGEAPSLAPPASAEESFLPDLVALCAENGARLVVIRAPLQSAAQEQATLAVPGLVSGARALVEGAGGAWVDLADLPLPPDAWDDDVHLGALGASRLTWHTARALTGQGAEATWLLDAPPRFTAAPPPLDLRAVHPERDAYVRLVVEGRLPLSDEACTEQEVARCCSPLAITRGGEPLPHTTKADVEHGRGWYHAESGVLAASGTGELAVGLDPSRHCGGWWLYPGDVATLAPAAPAFEPASLDLRLRADDDPPAGTLTLTLRAGEQIVMAQSTPVSSGLLRFYWPPLSSDLPFVLELATSPEASFVLLTEAALVPRAPMPPLNATPSGPMPPGSQHPATISRGPLL